MEDEYNFVGIEQQGAEASPAPSASSHDSSESTGSNMSAGGPPILLRDQFIRFLPIPLGTHADIPRGWGHEPGETGCLRLDDHGIIPYGRRFTVFDIRDAPFFEEDTINIPSNCLSEEPLPHSHWEHQMLLCTRYVECDLTERQAYEGVAESLGVAHSSHNHMRDFAMSISLAGQMAHESPMMIRRLSMHPTTGTLDLPGEESTLDQLTYLFKYWKVVEAAHPQGTDLSIFILPLIHEHQRSIMDPIIRKMTRREACLILTQINFPLFGTCCTCLGAWIISVMFGNQRRYANVERTTSYRCFLPEYIERVRVEVTVLWEILEARLATDFQEATRTFQRVKRFMSNIVGLNQESRDWLELIPDAWDYFWCLQLLLTHGHLAAVTQRPTRWTIPSMDYGVVAADGFLRSICTSTFATETVAKILRIRRNDFFMIRPDLNVPDYMHGRDDRRVQFPCLRGCR